MEPVAIRVATGSYFYMNKIYVTNADFSRMATELCNQLLSIKDKFEWVVGIKRGGLPLSNWLSYALGKKHSEIEISLYGDDTHKKKQRNQCMWYNPHNYDEYIKSPFLLVDDIVDSGETIKLFKELSGRNDNPKYWIATLHWCEENSPDCKPDFYVNKKHKTDWIIYPWEA